MCGEITEIHREAGEHVQAIDGGADQFESDLEAKLIVDDLRLGRGDDQVVCNAIAAVVGEETEYIGLRGFFGGGDGIVGEDITLQEVVERQHRLGQHGDRCGRQIEVDRFIGRMFGKNRLR